MLEVKRHLKKGRGSREFHPEERRKCGIFSFSQAGDPGFPGRERARLRLL